MYNCNFYFKKVAIKHIAVGNDDRNNYDMGIVNLIAIKHLGAILLGHCFLLSTAWPAACC